MENYLAGSLVGRGTVMDGDQSTKIAFGMAGVLLFLLFLLTFLLDETSRNNFVKEGGWVDGTSAFLFF